MKRDVTGVRDGAAPDGYGVAVAIVAAVERHVTSIFDEFGLHQSPDQHRRVLAVLRYLEA